ncbi:hypothetical protein CJF42_04745 [Pseudoalteromonas sp. NBT06-2]|uniref:MFS transporter n=1 Tax=Pseudoalteromonas sp. NBT06-2 TaxID=2025950 RepID=UPI000BA6BF03|nr:MFS transporter [Pseudoalteromonas sp. NBT06-2]PAJ75450.1 hypothetical protein CJF42_04745 [Pseudoalteromonas sp. NBT06-2]
MKLSNQTHINNLQQSDIIIHNSKWILLLILTIQFIAISDFMVVMPLGPDLARTFNIKVESTAWFSAGFTISAAISGLLCSSFLDKYDRKNSLIVLLIANCICIGLSSTSQSFAELTIFRSLCGFLSAPTTALTLAIVIDTIPPKKRGKALAKVALSFSFAAIIGVPVGLHIANIYGWQWVFILSATIMLILTIFAVFVLQNNKHKNSETEKFNLKIVISNKTMRLGITIVASSIFAVFLFIPHLSAIFQFNHNYPRSNISQLFMFGGLSTIFVTMICSKLIDKVSLFNMATFFTIAGILVITLGFALDFNLPVAIIFIFFMSVNAGRNLITQILLSQIAPPNQRAGYLAITTTARNIATGLAAFISAQILSSNDDLTINNLPILVMISACLMLLLPWQISSLSKHLSK